MLDSRRPSYDDRQGRINKSNRFVTTQRRAEQPIRDVDIPFDGCDTLVGRLLSNRESTQNKNTVVTNKQEKIMHSTSSFNSAKLAGRYKNVKTGEVIEIDDTGSTHTG